MTTKLNAAQSTELFFRVIGHDIIDTFIAALILANAAFRRAKS